MSERLHLLADASRILAETSLETSATLEALATILVPRLADDCVVFVVDDDGDIRRVAEASVSAEHAAVLRSLRDHPPAVGASNSVLTAVRSGEAVVVDSVDDRTLANLAGSTEHAASLRAVRPTTFITVPLVGRDKVHGAFTFGMSVSDRRYTRDDVLLAEELGRRTGMALDNAQLRRRAELAQQRMERLQTTAVALGRVMTPAETGMAVLEQGAGLLGADAGMVYVRRDDELQALASLRRDDMWPTMPLSADYPLTNSVRLARPVLVQNRDEMARDFPGIVDLVPLAVQASMVLPLVADGRVIGGISLNFARPRTFSVEDRRFAEALAAQGALAIDRALLIERDREHANRAAFLAEASELLAKSLERERVLDDLTRFVVPRFADWCTVELIEGETATQFAVGHVDPAKIAIGKELHEKYPSDPSLPHGVFQVVRTGKPELYAHIPDEVLERRARGTEYLTLLRQLGLRSALIVPLVASGKPIGALTAVWAESGRNYSEPDLEVFMELAHRAALAIENAQLYRDLQHAVQVRDDFLAAAGHELKTPLAALQMHVDSLYRQLQKNVIPNNMTLRLGKASRTGMRLARLIDELLDVSRITAGRLQLEPEPFALDELVREVVNRFEEHEASPIAMRAEPVAGTWDRARIDQVVSNLIANALKYGRGKPVDVEVGAHTGTAVLRVIDRGVGIAAEEQSKIFERFERAVANREFGGFGLGLWIARQIVETSGGSIEVCSELGKGATFTVKLPR